MGRKQTLAAADALSSTSREITASYRRRAWIERGSYEPELIVSGVVTTPTGGSWNVQTLGPTPWDGPPRQLVNLEVRAMGEIVTTVVTTETVQAHFRLPPHFGGPSSPGVVIIQCNGKEVERVRAVASSK